MLQRLDSDAQSGLDAAEVPRRPEKYGSNKLPEGLKQRPFMPFLMQLHNILVYVLLGAGFVKLMVGLWLDAGIIQVWCSSTPCSASFRRKAEKALDSIRNMLSAARTVRGGRTRMVPAENWSRGDIVLLESRRQDPLACAWST